MVSGNYLRSSVKCFQLCKLLLPVNPLVFTQHKLCHSLKQCTTTTTATTPTTANNNNIEESKEYLEKLEAAKNNPPCGSTLYHEDDRFPPIVSPDPIFNWEALRISLKARGLHDKVNIDGLIDLQKRISDLRAKMNALMKERTLLQKQYDEKKENSAEIAAAARAARNEHKSLEMSYKQLSREFERDSLQLPNILHHLTPVSSRDSQTSIKSYHHHHGTVCRDKKLLWSNLANDYYNEIIGTYYTGRLADLEYTHMNKVCHYWLTQSSNNYPVCLSDIVRGTVLEGTSWPTMKSAIRLRPSKGDMLFTEDPTTGTYDWIVNPHLTDYLVGSASLAAFSAYLILHRTNLVENSSMRLISKGSVYAYRNENVDSTSSNDDQPQADVKSPFQQSKQISILELSKNWNQCEAGFHVLVEDLFKFWQIYQPEWSIKLTYSQASNLYPCEMLRAVLHSDMKSSSGGGMTISVPLATVSVLSDWISRRIITKNIRSKQSASDCDLYPHMVFANVWNFQNVLSAFQQIGYIDEHSLPNVYG
ncbi:unnamed protein product [Trichobilharzia szidati]|nr:unnamed protein product [Trichobilharzia szidati]